MLDLLEWVSTTESKGNSPEEKKDGNFYIFLFSFFLFLKYNEIMYWWDEYMPKWKDSRIISTICGAIKWSCLHIWEEKKGWKNFCIAARSFNDLDDVGLLGSKREISFPIRLWLHTHTHSFSV